MGATYPRVDATNTNSARVTVLGKHWDDSILTSAKASFETDGWTSEAVEEGSNSAKFSKAVNGQKSRYLLQRCKMQMELHVFL